MDGRRALTDLSRRCSDLITGLGGDMLVDALTQVGMETKPLVEAGVRRDIGDAAMSGWRRGAPVQIVGRFDIYPADRVSGDTTGKSLVTRPTPRARGPMRVLEQGRHRGNARGISGPAIVQTGKNAGSTRRRKNGTIVVSKPAKARRWNGYTDPLRTWDDISSLITHRVPQVVPDIAVETVRKALLRG